MNLQRADADDNDISESRVVEELSCIRRPDTGQQSRGFRVLYQEPQYKRR